MQGLNEVNLNGILSAPYPKQPFPKIPSSTPNMSISPEFSELDWHCINTVRLLSADMVQAANSGHPGAPMGLAPLANVLFTRFLRFDPSDPKWVPKYKRNIIGLCFL